MDRDDDVVALAEHGGELATGRGLTVGIAESFTGGPLVQALARQAGSGEWVTGGIVSYAMSVKRDLLGVTAEEVVSRGAAEQLASAARERLGADVALSVPGVAGPSSQDDEPPGTVWIGIDDGRASSAALFTADGSPTDVCEETVTEALRRLVGALTYVQRSA